MLPSEKRVSALIGHPPDRIGRHQPDLAVITNLQHVAGPVGRNSPCRSLVGALDRVSMPDAIARLHKPLSLSFVSGPIR